jgi:2-polyprenyl-6-methoxyphenol hydroxylase-like FAD-dependent oxidoreductase
MPLVESTPLAALSPVYDAVIVGARCGGAPTGMLLARAGLRVLVVDRADAGSDTLSTHAFMRGGVLQLHRWGLLERLTATGVPPVRVVTFHYGDEALPVEFQARDGVDALYAPRRTVLDALLADAAREAGAEVAFGVRAEGPVFENGRVCGLRLTDASGSARTIRAGIVIGADGLRSPIAASVDAPVDRRGPHAAGALFGYWPGLGDDGYHWHYRVGASVGVIPTNDDLTCVFVVVPPARLRDALVRGPETAFRELVADAEPAIAARLAPLRPAGAFRAFPGTPGVLRRPYGPGWALVGDAGFFRDPITAHGMTDALRDAELLARAVVRGTAEAFAEYQADRDAIAVPMLDLSDAVAAFDWDLDQVRDLHASLTRAMGREARTIAAWDPRRAVAG